MYQSAIYPSKILLTGEYVALLGFPAIAIPWTIRYAEWEETGYNIDHLSLQFLHFLKEHSELKNHFLLNEFSSFIHRGGYLSGNIPYGYGLGSSGTYCAAVLDRFSNIDKSDEKFVFMVLKEMEHFFHGQSSGLDPLISFFKRPVIIENGSVTFPKFNSKLRDATKTNGYNELLTKFGIQLIDSKLNRNTQQLVSGFKELIMDSAYKSKLSNKIVPLNHAMIENLLNEDIPQFDKNWIELSKASLDIFRIMIPESVFNFWKQGIETTKYYCKLCGAGGGGLFLVKVIDEAFFRDSLKTYGIEIFR